jgi:hypothetical protein
MPTYTYNAQNPVSTTADNDHAVDLQIVDVAIVENGGSIRATGLDADGINGGSGVQVDGLVSASQGYGIIPTDADAHALAQSRRPMDMISQGRSVSLVQASQQ